MQNTKQILSILSTAAFLLVAALYMQPVTDSQAAPEEIAESFDWSGDGQLLTPNSAVINPKLVASGDEMISIFEFSPDGYQIGGPIGPSGISYTLSTDAGENWTAPATLVPISNTKTFGAITYDRNGTIHAAWLSQSENLLDIDLYYVNSSDGWPGQPQLIDSFENSIGGVSTLDIIESAPGVIDLVYEWPKQAGSPEIVVSHIRSTDGGSNWPEVGRRITDISSVWPRVAATGDGELYAAWEQQAIGGGSNVFAARYESGAQFWEGGILLSDSEAVSGSSKRPDIITADNGLYVAFDYEPETDRHFAYVISCELTDGCTTREPWGTIRDISGQTLTVNSSDPSFLSPQLTTDGTHVFAHFHGAPSGANEEREIVWGSNSCASWSDDSLDQVTDFGARNIYPYGAMVGEVMHMVYLEATENRVYYEKSEFDCSITDGIFLPFIRR